MLSGQAMAYVINDNYYGADDHGYGDVIGNVGKFGIDRMEVSHIGSILTVDIYTAFAGRGDDGLFSSYTTGGTGIGYGDLFLASSWNPDTTAANYLNDDYSTGTTWEYGFSLDNRWWDGVDSSGGSATLYALNGATNADNALITEDFMTGAIYRNGQEIAVKNANDQTDLGSGVWSIENGFVRMSMDLAGTGLLDDGDLALHWGMTCGNDTIEGEYQYDVPEPTTLSLMGLSLLGLGFIGRRRKYS